MINEPFNEFAGSWLDYEKDGYGDTLSIIAHSRYYLREDLIYCYEQWGKEKFICPDRLFCPRHCDIHYAWSLKQEFAHKVTGEEVYFVVISISETQGSVTIDPSLGTSSRGPITHHPPLSSPNAYGIPFTKKDFALVHKLWDLYAEAIHEFCIQKGFRGLRGAIGAPELGVQFLPPRVIPHMNFILWAPGLTADDVRDLRNYVGERIRKSPIYLDWRQSNGEPAFYPSIDVNRIADRAEFETRIKYSVKPIRLGASYREAASRNRYAESAMIKLNEEVNDFLSRVQLVFAGVMRVRRWGVCHSRAEHYIGVTSDYKRAKNEKKEERKSSNSLDETSIKSRRPRGKFGPRARYPEWKRQSEILRKNYAKTEGLKSPMLMPLPQPPT